MKPENDFEKNPTDDVDVSGFTLGKLLRCKPSKRQHRIGLGRPHMISSLKHSIGFLLWQHEASRSIFPKGARVAAPPYLDVRHYHLCEEFLQTSQLPKVLIADMHDVRFKLASYG